MAHELSYSLSLDEINAILSKERKYTDANTKNIIEVIPIIDNEGKETADIEKDTYIVSNSNYTGTILKSNINFRHGFGSERFSESWQYSGEWHSNIIQGYGIAFYTKLDNYYFGGWENNQKNGKGLYYWQDKQVWFYGDYSMDNLKEGLWFNCQNKTLYKGKFKKGKKHDQNGVLNKFGENIFIGQIDEDDWGNGVFAKYQNCGTNGDEDIVIKIINMNKVIVENNELELENIPRDSESYADNERKISSWIKSHHEWTEIFEELESKIKDEFLPWKDELCDYEVIKSGDGKTNLNSIKDVITNAFEEEYSDGEC